MSRTLSLSLELAGVPVLPARAVKLWEEGAMLRDKSIEQSLVLLGYERIETRIVEWADIHRPFVFKAKRDSDDVEHFLYFGADIKDHKYLVGKFGVRSRMAEDFR